ncbi:MAG: tetratricopeptide repeat protein [Chitinivibrionales bacterium]|nr:tetratricopeptide repeat protein [Chitinivibrionales bacterium]
MVHIRTFVGKGAVVVVMEKRKNFYSLLSACVLLCFALGSVTAEEASDYIHYRLGIKYKRENDHGRAIEEFRKVLAAYPDNYNAYMHLAEIRKMQNRPRLVIYNLKKSLAYNPGWGKAHKLLADAYEADRQYQKAIMELQLYQQACDPAERDSVQNKIDNLIQRVTGKSMSGTSGETGQTVSESKASGAPVKSSSGSRAPRRSKSSGVSQKAEEAFEQGVLLYSEKKYDESLQHLKQCLRYHPGHPGAYYYAALIRRRQGKNQMAKINFLKSLSYPELGYNAHFYLGKILGEEKNYAEAIKHLTKYTNSTDYGAGKEESRALIALYKKAMKDPSAEVPVVDVKGIGEEHLRDEIEKIGPEVPYNLIEVRIDALLSMTIVDTLTDPGQAMLKGVREFNKGNFDKAIKEFREVQVSYPTADVAAHCIYDVGVCYLKMGLFTNADNQFQQIIDRYPSHPLTSRSLFLKGLCFLEKGESAVAEKILRSFIRKYRSHEWAGKAYENLGDAYVDLEQHKKAIDAYSQAAVLAANGADKVYAHHKAGTCYLEVNNASRAVANFKKAIEEGESEKVYERVPDSYYKIADYYYQQKKYEEAMKYYKQVTRKYSKFQETPWGLFQIGNIYKSTRDYQKAIETYRNLLGKYPDDYWARQAKWKMEDTIWEHEYQAILQ